MRLDRFGQEKTWNPENNVPREVLDMKIAPPGWWKISFEDKTKTYINHPWTLYPDNQHFVLDTDYDNYAVIYGCDYWGLPFDIPFVHNTWSTLLSRSEFLEYPYVKKAKDLMKAIDYPYGTDWMKPGVDCGYDAALTLDEIMMKVFDHEPWWPDYKGTNDKGEQWMKIMF
jgi:hypothetical protein